ncbi:FtsK/SpoIIIE domain-containing protein [Fictibacillus norfolkensis]|uniref:AAA family ATPase n=1 Tax=Fictibacillus norfolkensis TaxID=2762233 RepID=A0ABR8SRX9_9BACL|nr:FtsK/SpoIIIE domain-containing protein [Fictibacillus norfolkensis]MBD7966265.1 AAA family ATPase [Fictibacillus norfolkensis]
MIFSIASSLLLGGVAGYGYLKTNGVTNDADKIQRIFANAGWTKKEDGETKTIRLRRRRKIENGMEYVYQLPLGFDRKKVDTDVLADGLNTKKIAFDITKVKFNKDILKQIKQLKGVKANKQVELDFDGMLKIRVYENDLGKEEWSDGLLKGGWKVPVGKTQQGKMIYHDFDNRKHLIVAGATGFGKSVAMKMMITSLIMNKPDDVTFSLIDLKGGPAFARFKKAKQVTEFGTDNTEALEIIQKVKERMDDDYRKIVEGGFEDVIEAGLTKRHFIIVDEAADLSESKESLRLLTDIVRKGRGAGYYVIYATQYPTAEAIPMQIKRNIPARLCYVVDSSTASTVVLDGAGAESLPEIPGRGIYKNVKQIILQTPFMSNEQIKERIKPFEEEKHELPRTPSTEDRKHTLVTEKA